MSAVKTQAVTVRDNSGVKQNDKVSHKQQSLGLRLKKLFSSEEIMEEYFALHYKTDFTFKKHMLAVEIDEKCHNERPANYERERQEDLEKFSYYFIRINPDKSGFDNYEEFGRVSSYIAKSIKKQTEELTKKSLIGCLSKRLLEFEFKSNHSMKSKCLKWVAKKILSTI